MAEQFPSDTTLNALSGTADGEQAVPYIPVGLSPYHTEFYKMLYRLLDVARRAGDLRVYKDDSGALKFGVRGRAVAQRRHGGQLRRRQRPEPDRQRRSTTSTSPPPGC